MPKKRYVINVSNEQKSQLQTLFNNHTLHLGQYIDLHVDRLLLNYPTTVTPQIHGNVSECLGIRVSLITASQIQAFMTSKHITLAEVFRELFEMIRKEVI